MLKLKTKKCKKINANTVGTDATFRPHIEENTKNTPAANSNLNSNISFLISDHKAITLVALIITIIVMLILVGVTVNVALNGGLFEKAKKATYQTEVSEIQEQLEVKKAMKIAENDGKIPSDYGFTINDLDIASKLKDKYNNKLKISDGILYYDGEVVTSETERNWLEEMGITEFKKIDNTPHEIHVGDKWTNVKFDNIATDESKIEFDKSDNPTMIFIEDKNTGYWWVLYLLQNPYTSAFNFIVYVENPSEMYGDCGYAYEYVWSDYTDGSTSLPAKIWSQIESRGNPDVGTSGICGEVKSIIAGEKYCGVVSNELTGLISWSPDNYGEFSENEELCIKGGLADWLSGSIESSAQ